MHMNMYTFMYISKLFVQSAPERRGSFVYYLAQTKNVKSSDG